MERGREGGEGRGEIRGCRWEREGKVGGRRIKKGVRVGRKFLKKFGGFSQTLMAQSEQRQLKC